MKDFNKFITEAKKELSDSQKVKLRMAANNANDDLFGAERTMHSIQGVVEALSKYDKNVNKDYVKVKQALVQLRNRLSSIDEELK